MTYQLLIGNNFILNNPKKVNFKNSQIFSLNEDNEGPYVNTELFDITGSKIIEIIKNNVIFCNRELKTKFMKRDHILILDKNGEIILESRVVNKDTIIVSGRFVIEKELLTITQNYISFANGKKIMHSKVKSNNASISITENGIKSNN
ncbi:MAG: hypothetical protein K0S93_1145 [Nitrososphaeraceae archaeon]|nr:hypothetical protein [Nitrososphaeraceae archaeon]